MIMKKWTKFSKRAVTLLLVAVMVVTSAFTYGNVVKAEEPGDLTPYITSMTVYADGVVISDDTEYSPSQTFKFDISFSEEGKDSKLKETMTFKMPNNLVNYPASGTLKDQATNKDVANYTVDNNGNVTIQFTDEGYLNAINDPSNVINGVFSFEANVNNSSQESKVSIKIPDTNVEKVIHFDNEAKLEATKSYSGYVAEKGFYFTIEIIAKNGSVNDIEITDTLGSGLVLNDDTYSLQFYNPWKEGTTGHFSSLGNNVYKISGLNLSENQKVYISYYADLTDDLKSKIVNGENVSFDTVTNTASITGEDSSGTEITINPSPVQPTFQVNTWLYKNNATLRTDDEGNYIFDQNGNYILDWKIIYNGEQKLPVKGITLTDTIDTSTLSSHTLQIGDKIHVKRYDTNNNSIEFDIDINSTTGWTYTIGSATEDIYNNDNEVYKYEFRYSTYVSKEQADTFILDQSVSNAVSDDKGHSSNGSGIIPGMGKSTKEATSVTADEIQWKIVLRVPGNGVAATNDASTATAYIEDLISTNSWDQYGIIKEGSINVTSDTNVNYVVQSEIIDQGGSNKKRTYYYVFFGDDVSESKSITDNKKVTSLPSNGGNNYEIVITYTTLNQYKYVDNNEEKTGDFAEGTYVTNTAKVLEQTLSSQVQLPEKPKLYKTTGSYYYYNQAFDTKDNRISYRVEININRQDLGDQDIIIKDIFDKRMTLDGTTVHLLKTTNQNAYNSNEDKYWTADHVTISEVSQYSDTQDEVTFNLGKLTDVDENGKPYIYVLFYQMVIDDNIFTSKDSVTMSNSAIMTYKNNIETTPVSYNYSYRNPAITKGMTKPDKNANYVGNCTINVRALPELLITEDNNKILYIQDDYTNLMIDKSSIVVQEDGVQISSDRLIINEEDNDTQKSLLFKIIGAKENSDYVITYKAELIANVGETVTYSNYAKILGHEESYVSGKEDTVTKEQTSSGSVTYESLSFKLYKYNSENFAISLAGAKFKLLDENGNTLIDEIEIQDGGYSSEIKTTDDNKGFQKYKKYSLVETKAPTGYNLDETPIEFYLTNNTKSQQELKELGLSGILALDVTKRELNVINISNVPKGLTIKKVDKTDNTILLKGAKFKLVNSNDSTKIYLSTDNKDGTYSFAKVADGEYKLYETKAPEGYNVIINEIEIATIKVEDGLYYKDNVLLNISDISNMFKVENSKPNPIAKDFAIKKELVGRDWKEGDVFKFSIVADTQTQNVIDAGHVVMPSDTTLTISDSTENHTASFGNITFKKAGVYSFKVTEESGQIGGITYSDKELTYTITVTDNGTGTLIASDPVLSVNTEKNDNSVDNIFTNTYSASDATQTFSVTKELTGRSWKDTDSFIFNMVAGNDATTTAITSGDVVMPSDTTLTISDSTENHTASFGNITFKKAGVYSFKVTENAGNISKITYSDKELTYTITVTDNGTGTLVASEPVLWVNEEKNDKTKNSVFTNTYNASSTGITLTATKTLTGKTLEEGQFTFLLKDSTGQILQTKKNKADGSITFDEIRYDSAGTYEYTVEEEKGGSTEKGITYDSGKYVVTVVVRDDGEGKLTATKTIKKADDTVEAITFANTYNASSTGITLNATKTLNGKKLEDKEFEFSVYDENGNIVSKGVNCSSGKIVFEEIQYDTVGDYKYTIKEVHGGETIGRVIYDDSEFDVIVHVIDDGEGQLVATVEYPDNGVHFVNTYSELTKLIIYKVDQDHHFLEGANFQMIREDGTVINAVKDIARFEFKDLIDGIYIVKETTTPKGYEGIGEFEIVIENGKITCPQYGITDPFVTLSVENRNDDFTPEVIGDEFDDDDFYGEVYGDETIETSDSNDLLGYTGLSLLSAALFLILRKKKQLNS